MPITRPYLLTDRRTGAKRAVVAASPAAAYRYVATDTYDISVPSALELARLMGDGLKLEECSDET